MRQGVILEREDGRPRQARPRQVVAEAHLARPVQLSDCDTLRFGGDVTGADAGYDKFVFMFRAPEAPEPDREAEPLERVPAVKRPTKEKPVRPGPRCAVAQGRARPQAGEVFRVALE